MIAVVYPHYSAAQRGILENAIISSTMRQELSLNFEYYLFVYSAL
jgi:hypothetical protein